MKLFQKKRDATALNSPLIRRPIQKCFWLFLLPTFAAFCIGFLYPFCKGFFLSFCVTTKGTDEPYRMMTSRAEHRLYLRQDNADLRLTARAHEIGLATDERMRRMEQKERDTSELIRRLEDAGMAQALKRPEAALTLPDGWDYSPAAREQAQIQIKYEGYLQKEMAQIRQARAMEEALIPPDADYAHMDALRLEARQKLAAQRPVSLGQASRIPGVSPADVAVLMVWLKRQGQG